MSAKAAVKQEDTPAQGTGTDLKVVQGGALDASFLAEAAEFAGAGTSSQSDDNIVPFVTLLQDLSPETKKRDPKYVEGAEAGMWVNKATGKLYTAFDFQPCAFNRVIMEWVPRDAGGGIVGRHAMTGTPEATMQALGGKEVPDNRDSSGRKTKWVMPNGNDLIDTRYYFGHIVDAEGAIEPVVMSFSSTGHGPARQFMTMQRGPNAQINTPKGSVIVPAWFRKYKVGSTTRSNNQGEWFVPKFEDYAGQGWITDAAARNAGKTLHDSVMAGTVQAANEEDPMAGGTGGNATDDIPI